MLKKRKKLTILLLIVFCGSIICGCASPSSGEKEAFPYKDLTEEAYLKNAHDFWNELLPYLEKTDEQDLESAIKDFEDPNKSNPEKITAGAMVMLFHDYLLRSSGETTDSIAAMSEQDRESFFQKNRKKIEQQIPNAHKVQQDTMEKRKDGKGVVGTYNFRNKEQITLYEDGDLLLQPL